MVVALRGDILIIAFYDKTKEDERADPQSSEVVRKHVNAHMERLTSPNYLTAQDEDRGDESGPRRIGNQLHLQLDMYTMLYVSTIYSEYYYVRDKKDKEKKRQEDLLTESVIKRTDLTDDKNKKTDTEWLDFVIDEKSELKIKVDKLGTNMKDLAEKLRPEQLAFEEKIKNLLSGP